MTRIMVFGIFDGPHESHAEVLAEAKAYGDHLMVVVAQDHIVEQLRGMVPVKNLAARFDALKAYDDVAEVVIGDADEALWRIVKRYQPEVIAFASDQSLLREDFMADRAKLDYEPKIVNLIHSEFNSPAASQQQL